MRLDVRSCASRFLVTELGLPEVRRVLEARDARELAEHDKWAAVAMLLRQTQAGPEVFFIRRAEHPRDPWSGHMAFPGGRQHAEDSSLLDTAIRETLEEVGLDLRAVFADGVLAEDGLPMGHEKRARQRVWGR